MENPWSTEKFFVVISYYIVSFSQQSTSSTIDKTAYSTTNTSNVNDEITVIKVILDEDISLVKLNSSKADSSKPIDTRDRSASTEVSLQNDSKESTQPQFVQEVMTSLGLNSCPSIPPDLGIRNILYTIRVVKGVSFKKTRFCRTIF